MSVILRGKNTIWYYLDITPLGSRGTSCTSYESCKKATGKIGFDIGVLVHPALWSRRDNEHSLDLCRQVTCATADCSDAFSYPGDRTTKLINLCPSKTYFYVVYCPTP